MVNKRVYVPGSDRHLRRPGFPPAVRREGPGALTMVLLTAALAASAMGFSYAKSQTSPPPVTATQ